MKKMLVLTVCAVMTFGAFVTPAQAGVASFGRQDGVAYERDYGGPGNDRRSPRRDDRNDRRDYRHDNNRRDDRRHHDDRRRGSGGSNSWLGFGIGAAIGSAIGAVIANQAPEPEPSMVYDPACNCYYYK